MTKGFSLIECLFTLAIMGILASIAYPSYLSHLTKVHRTDAQLSLFNLASLLETYYFEHHTYQDANVIRLNGTDQSYQKYYTLRIEALSPKTYTLIAVPNGAQALHDKACQALTLDERGQKGVATGQASDCW